MMNRTWIAIPSELRSALIAGSLSIFAATHADAATLALYDGTKNTSLSSQGWFSVIPTGATQTVGSGGTTLNTTSSSSLKAGYFRTAPLPLNGSTGYTLGFNVQLLSETHNSFDRAGFSVIALGSDRRGIELGFWTNEATSRHRIWAQNDGATKPPRFTHSEGTAFNPSSGNIRYDLSVLGNSYRLFANRNFQTTILTGNLRNYSPEGSPYTTPNFLFLGDNTTSAKGSVKITRVDLTNSATSSGSRIAAGTTVSSVSRLARITAQNSATAQSNLQAGASVPEPTTLMGSGLALGLVHFIQKRRRKTS